MIQFVLTVLVFIAVNAYVAPVHGDYALVGPSFGNKGDYRIDLDYVYTAGNGTHNLIYNNTNLTVVLQKVASQGFDYTTLVATLVGIGTIIVGILTYFFHRRQLKLNGLVEAFKLMNDERHRLARRDVYLNYQTHKKRGGDISDFIPPENIRDSVEIVRADFDQLGILMRRGSIHKKAILDAYGLNGFQCYEMLRNHIEQERDSRHFDEYMRNFQEFAKEAYHHWWKREGRVLKAP